MAGAIAGVRGPKRFRRGVHHQQLLRATPVKVHVAKTFAFIAISMLGHSAMASLPPNSGDINADGVRDIVDVQCFVQAALATLAQEPVPHCVARPLSEVDLVCDGVINVQDVVRCATIVLYVLSQGDPEITALLKPLDLDMDLVADSCDPDIDGDGFPNDCELALGTNPWDLLSKPDNPFACIQCPSGCATELGCVAAGLSPPGNPCLACHPAVSPLGWTQVNGIPCNDNNFCTLADQCQAGVCAGPIQVVCNDLNPCTADQCDAVAGCVFTPISGPCSDNNACTAGEACSLTTGKCEGGAPVNCDDNNPCTGDGCQPAVGCVHMNIQAACDDGNVCTPTHSCVLGNCVGSGQINCDDGNPCTLNGCHPITGCTTTPTPGAPCLDGNPCTINEICVGSSCIGPVADDLYGCGSPETVACKLSGNANSTSFCEFKVARANLAQPSATGIQFTLSYDPKVLELINFFDELCFVGAGCFMWPMSGPGSLPLSTGHSVSVAPPNIADWKGITCNATKPCAGGAACVAGYCAGSGGFGGVVIVNASNPEATLSDAWFTSPTTVEGQPLFLLAEFRLLQFTPALAPANIAIGGLAATDGASAPLSASLYLGVLSTYESE